MNLHHLKVPQSNFMLLHENVLQKEVVELDRMSKAHVQTFSKRALTASWCLQSRKNAAKFVNNFIFPPTFSFKVCVSKLKVFMIRHTCILHFHGRKKLLAIERRQSLKQFSRSICSESNGNRTAPASHFPISREVASMSCYAHHGEIIMLADRKSMKHTPQPKISLLICQK